MEVQIIKRLVDDMGNVYKIGDLVYFLLDRCGKVSDCWGTITDITDEYFELSNAQLNDLFCEGGMKIRVDYSEVKSGFLY